MSFQPSGLNSASAARISGRPWACATGTSVRPRSMLGAVIRSCSCRSMVALHSNATGGTDGSSQAGTPHQPVARSDEQEHRSGRRELAVWSLGAHGSLPTSSMAASRVARARAMVYHLRDRMSVMVLTEISSPQPASESARPSAPGMARSESWRRCRAYQGVASTSCRQLNDYLTQQ